MKGDNISRSRSEGRVGGRRLVSITKEPYRTATFVSVRICIKTLFPHDACSYFQQAVSHLDQDFFSLRLLCFVRSVKQRIYISNRANKNPHR